MGDARTARGHRTGLAHGTLRRLSARLGRERTPAPATCLIVTSRHRLWQRYGPEGVQAVEQAVGDLAEAMAGRGLTGTLVYVDDSALLTRLGVLPADPGQAAPVARVIRDLAARLAASGERVRYVLILGGHEVVPFDRPENPSPDDEDALYSDHVYAVDAGQPLHPVRAVGRIPDAGLDLLLQTIRACAAEHRRRAPGRPPPASGAVVGYSASVWKRAARGVFAVLGEPSGLRLSPPLTHAEAPGRQAAGVALGYYNLHGLVDSAHWFGQRDPIFAADFEPYPVALRPEDIGPAAGALVFSEACFGAHLNGRAVHDSIALTGLRAGATAFVGATGVAYGGLDDRLVAADLLAHRFWEGVLAGLPVGAALARAKGCLAGEAIARQGYLDAEDEKAIANFVLYGDPSLHYPTPSRRAEDAARLDWLGGAVESAGPAGMVGIPPARPRSAAEVPAERLSAGDTQALAAHVRQAVARRLPEFDAEDVAVALAPASAGGIAKSGGGEPSRAADRLIVTLRRSVATSEGSRCQSVLRATVDPRGHIRKLTLSR